MSPGRLLALGSLALLALAARASDDMQIYSGGQSASTQLAVGPHGWQLQSQTNSLADGLGTNWVNVAGSAQTNRVPLTMNPANGAEFFRLVRL